MEQPTQPSPQNQNKGWDAEDQRCPHCNQVTKLAKGMNKQNLKKLIFSKPTMQDWILLFVIVMVLLIAWRYNAETEQCRYVVSHIYDYCDGTLKANQPFGNSTGFNATNFTLALVTNGTG